MDGKKFIEMYSRFRNGTDNYYAHPLVPFFVFTDGVKECAETGLYWFIDILATEAVNHIKKSGHEFMIVKMTASEGKAIIHGEMVDEDPEPWLKKIPFTDCPDGIWTFFIQYDGTHYVMLLPSEY